MSANSKVIKTKIHRITLPFSASNPHNRDVFFWSIFLKSAKIINKPQNHSGVACHPFYGRIWPTEFQDHYFHTMSHLVFFFFFVFCRISKKCPPDVLIIMDVTTRRRVERPFERLSLRRIKRNKKTNSISPLSVLSLAVDLCAFETQSLLLHYLSK